MLIIQGTGYKNFKYRVQKTTINCNQIYIYFENVLIFICAYGSLKAQFLFAYECFGLRFWEIFCTYRLQYVIIANNVMEIKNRNLDFVTIIQIGNRVKCTW